MFSSNLVRSDWRIKYPHKYRYLYVGYPGFFDNNIKTKNPAKSVLAGLLNNLYFLFVIPLGLEPRAHTLKVYCSTNWATESSFVFKRSAKIRLLVLYAKTFSNFLSFTGLYPISQPLYIPCKCRTSATSAQKDNFFV